jgi:hypothetical protein
MIVERLGAGRADELKGGADLKTVTGLLPFAVVLAGIGWAVSWLLARDVTIGRWVLGGFLVAHGLIHSMFVLPAPATAAADGTAWPFDMSQSWLVTGAGLDPGPVRLVGAALVVVVAVGFLLAGLATVGVVVPSGWWPFLVAGSAATSVLLLALFFSPTLILGVAIDAVLAWVVLALVWSPAASS